MLSKTSMRSAILALGSIIAVITPSLAQKPTTITETTPAQRSDTLRALGLSGIFSRDCSFKLIAVGSDVTVWDVDSDQAPLITIIGGDTSDTTPYHYSVLVAQLISQNQVFIKSRAVEPENGTYYEDGMTLGINGDGYQTLWTSQFGAAANRKIRPLKKCSVTKNPTVAATEDEFQRCLATWQDRFAYWRRFYAYAGPDARPLIQADMNHEIAIANKNCRANPELTYGK
jgi:hypothetical protein